MPIGTYHSVQELLGYLQGVSQGVELWIPLSTHQLLRHSCIENTIMNSLAHNLGFGLNYKWLPAYKYALDRVMRVIGQAKRDLLSPSQHDLGAVLQISIFTLK